MLTGLFHSLDIQTYVRILPFINGVLMSSVMGSYRMMDCVYVMSQ